MRQYRVQFLLFSVSDMPQQYQHAHNVRVDAAAGYDSSVHNSVSGASGRAEEGTERV